MALLDKMKFWKKEEEPLAPPEGFGALEEEPGRLPGEGAEFPGGEPGVPGPALPPIEGTEQETGLPPELQGVDRQPPTQARAPIQQVPTQVPPQHQMEVISAKLDAIKASLDNINIRLERIERATPHGQEQAQQWYK